MAGGAGMGEGASSREEVGASAGGRQQGERCSGGGCLIFFFFSPLLPPSLPVPYCLPYHLPPVCTFPAAMVCMCGRVNLR